MRILTVVRAHAPQRTAVHAVEHAAHAPRFHRTVGYRQLRVRHDQIRIDVDIRTEPGAVGTGAVRVVEREHPGAQFFEADGAVGAGELLTLQGLADGLVGQLLPNTNDALGQFEAGLDGVRQPSSNALLDHEPVDHDVDVVFDVPLEFDGLVETVELAVHPDPDESLAFDVLEGALVRALPLADDRRQELDAGAFGQREDAVDDGLGRL